MSLRQIFPCSMYRYLVVILFVPALLLSGCAGLLESFPHPGSKAAPQASVRFPLPEEGVDVIGTLQVAIANNEDTLADIARRYNLGFDEIVAANPGVDPWLPREGTEILLPTVFVLPPGPREGVVLNLPAMRLYYYPVPEEGKPAEVVTYPIGIGREGWETPLGEFTITQKTANPSWTVPASVRREHAELGDPLPAVVPPGPDNPLGEFAMRLSLPSYLIHGTNKPWGVGMRVSHGCVRLYPEDIARLFPEVPLGTPVRILNEPYLLGWRKGMLYLEAHVPLAEDGRSADRSIQLAEEALAQGNAGHAARLDPGRVTAVTVAEAGLPMPVLAGGADLAALVRHAPRVTSTPDWSPQTYEVEIAEGVPAE
ncbi:L,D-transpeptidase family protein [Haliea sp. E17]|uniref:L,D-transpeptidase family protein n=1 Tax=Haliea sp. E17 TaxID=3401576 RepID=UPI003AAC65BB